MIGMGVPIIRRSVKGFTWRFSSTYCAHAARLGSEPRMAASAGAKFAAAACAPYNGGVNLKGLLPLLEPLLAELRAFLLVLLCSAAPAGSFGSARVPFSKRVPHAQTRSGFRGAMTARCAAGCFTLGRPVLLHNTSLTGAIGRAISLSAASRVSRAFHLALFFIFHMLAANRALLRACRLLAPLIAAAAAAPPRAFSVVPASGRASAALLRSPVTNPLLRGCAWGAGSGLATCKFRPSVRASALSLRSARGGGGGGGGVR
jgi:hypothetical protein